MNFHVMTLFPEMITAWMGGSITGRALKKGILTLNAVDIRDYTLDKNRRVDDYIYGGGSGMLMAAEPVVRCYDELKKKIGGGSCRVLYMTPRGRQFDGSMARALSHNENIIFLCGHYEGIDERAIEYIRPVEVSIGDFILTGGEIAAVMLMDAISRFVPGVLGSPDSAFTESFSDGLLEYPQYTRPEEFRGMRVPPVLLSGDHKKIDEWRMAEAVAVTRERRPDLYKVWLEKEQRKKKKSHKKRKKRNEI